MILTDLSSAALGRASKRNLTEFFQFLRRAPSVEFLERDGLCRWLTHVPHVWFNGIFLGRSPRPGDQSFLDDAAHHFALHQVAQFSCWIDVDVDRAAWHTLLDAHGFHYDTGAPGMALTLDALPTALDLPQGVSFRRIQTSHDLETWCSVFIAGYELPAAWRTDLCRLMNGLGLNFPVANYLGSLDGQPVVTSNVFYGAGVAGVQFVATLPSARRHGLGGLATLFPLYDARARGYNAAVLQSSEMGISVYRRLGFRKVYDVDNYFKASEL